MNAASLILLILSHGGHWLAGSTATISVGWAADVKAAPAIFVWDLRFGDVSAASGQFQFHDMNNGVGTLAVPAVRRKTDWALRYRVAPLAGGADLEAGTLPIRIYPDDLLTDYSPRYAGKRVYVVETDGRIGKYLKAANVAFTTLADISQIGLARPDVLFVGRNMLDDVPFGQSAFEPLATGGCQIFVFRQNTLRTLLGFSLGERDITASFAWRKDHSLLDGFDEMDRSGLLDGHRSAVALHLPQNEPALAIAYWPPEIAKGRPAAIDALLITCTLGKGRIVLCQLPLDEAADDPVGMLFFDKVLNYLSTRPEPTPASQNSFCPPMTPASPPPMIQIPAGDRP